MRKELTMKVLPISDIHGKPSILSYILDNFGPDDFDVLTVSGDVWEGTSPNNKYKWDSFQKDIKKPIIMIQGNHDFWSTSAFDEYPDIHLLHNESIEIDGVKFFGTPYTTTFLDWNWMSSEEKLFLMWNELVPSGIDVMLSHGPPFGYCDNVNQKVYGHDADSKLGSKALLAVLMDKAPKYVFCGHIHSGDKFKEMDNGTKIYNVSCLDESYQFGGYNPLPEVIELEL